MIFFYRSCAALIILLGHHVSAFIVLPTALCQSPRSRQQTIILLQGGGIEGSPAEKHRSKASDGCGKPNSGNASSTNSSEEVRCRDKAGDDDEDDDEPFPIWKGMLAFEAGQLEPPPAGVIIVDPFCDYLGKRCISILEEAGYAVVQVLSDHLVATLNNEGAERFRPPKPGKEAEWASMLPFPLVAVICESDAGLANAERMQAALLGPRFGGINEARRDKFLMNEAMRDAGLAAVRQIKTGDKAKVREFLAALKGTSPPPEQDAGLAACADAVGDVAGDVAPGERQRGSALVETKMADTVASAGPRANEREEGGDDDDVPLCLDNVVSVVKPPRGCASGSVFRCRGEEEALEAFDKILGTAKYGSPGKVNDEVLVQEFLAGTEYVVDTVSRDGEHKAVAIWRYDKRPANGAPFVYFSIKLMPSDGEAEQRVVEYAFKALDALGIKFGPTHTEVMMVTAAALSGAGEIAAEGAGTPTLVEVNTRWHLTDFAPLTDACIGYNAVEETLSAFLKPEKFGALPRVPPAGGGSRFGRVVHLVSFVEGQLDEVLHEEEIRNMESFAGIDVYADPKNGGSGHVQKTIDIRSDAGWVRLVHDREEVVERDYRRCVELMPTMFRVTHEV